MIRLPNSIRGRLFLWFFTFTSLLLIVFGFSIYYRVKDAIFSSIDNTIHSKAQLIEGLVHVEKDGNIEFELSESISGEYSIPYSGHYYKIVLDGKVIAHSRSLVNENFDLSSGALEYQNRALKDKVYASKGPDNEPAMVLRHDIGFPGATVNVFVAEGITKSLSLINRLGQFLFIAIPASILFGSIVGSWIVKKSLSPLREFSLKVDRITHASLNERLNTETKVHELTELAASFNDMLNRLQNAFEAESRFISDASHELKTPVSVIKSHCDITLQKKRTEDEYIDTLSTIKTVSTKMADIINDMFSLMRLDSGLLNPTNFKAISLNDCIEGALDLCMVPAERKHVTFNTSIESGINIFGDKGRLTEAFLNIIQNGVIYSKENGSINISAVKANNYIITSIEDTGVGIKKDELDKIFERFYRSDASRSSEGTGMGLSIAKAIIQAHRGSISVRSEIGKGSCFSIILPIAA